MKRRRYSLIPHNARETSPRRILIVDVVSTRELNAKSRTGWVEKWRLATCIYAQLDGDGIWHIEQTRFQDRLRFWSYLESKLNRRSTLYCFGHGLGSALIMAGIEKWIDEGEHRPSFAAIRGKPWILSVPTARGRVKFCCITNYFPLKMDELAHRVRIKVWPEPNYIAPNSEWFDYSSKRSEIVFNAITWIIDYWRTHELGYWGPTSASLSWSCYRHCYMDHKIQLHPHESVTNLERAAYCGGHFDCFYLGSIESPVHHIDVNGNYASVMRDYPYPVALAGHEINPTILGLRGIVQSHVAIARVRVRPGKALYPLKVGKTLYHVEGPGCVVLCGNELERALACEEITHVEEASWYDCDYIFSRFVDHWYAKKVLSQNQGRRMESLLASLFYKSLWGKFGQWGEDWEPDTSFASGVSWGYDAAYDADKDEWTWYRLIGRKVEKLKERGEWRYAFPAIAAMVSANARVEVASVREKLPPEAVYYQGCDCLLVSDAALRRLESLGRIDRSALGRWKVAHHGSGGEIWGVNHYRVGDSWTYPNGAAAAAGRSAGVCESRSEAPPQATLFSAWPDGVIVRQAIQGPPLTYEKRKMTGSGWTEPYSIMEVV